jgi:hypothetical protein
VPPAVSERDVAEDLLEPGPAPRDLLADKGFSGKAFAASQAARGTAVLVPPCRGQRAAMPSILLKVIAEWRNRIETTFSEITDQMELARQGAHTFRFYARARGCGVSGLSSRRRPGWSRR